MLSYCFEVRIIKINDYLFIPKQLKMSHTTKLHWHKAAPTQSHNTYELWNDEQRLLSLDFNPFSQTAKVECETSRRNFKIEKEGFLRNKTILKNEYGVKIGELGAENWLSHEGFMQLNGEILHYTIQNSPLAELVIYKSSKKKPLIVCGLKPNNGDASIHFEEDNESDKYPCLLMTICWFLFTPVAKKHVREYAA